MRKIKILTLALFLAAMSSCVVYDYPPRRVVVEREPVRTYEYYEPSYVAPAPWFYIDPVFRFNFGYYGGHGHHGGGHHGGHHGHHGHHGRH